MLQKITMNIDSIFHNFNIFPNMVFKILFSTGYDSDVEREKNIDYNTKIYVNPIREKEGTKPHLQEHAEVEK